MMYDEATLALMPPADRAAAVALMDAQYGGQGLAEYIEQHNPTEPVQPHLEPLVELLERTRHERVFACLDLPPRHAKTTTIGRGLAWLLGFAPADTHAYVTYNDRQAKSKSRPIRAQALRAGVQLDNATSNLSEWRTTAGGGLLAVGANAGITGQGVSGVFVFDDPYANRRQADSPVYREMIWDLFTEVVFTRLEKASVIIVHTRWHDDDLIGRIKKRHAAGELPALFPWEFVSMPALAQENDILGRAPGEALWPTRFAVPELHAIRETIGEWSFGALYQGNPQPKGSKLFSEPHLYDPAKVDFTGFRIYIGVDPAATAQTRADWSVAVAIAIRGQGTQQVGFVLDVLREQNDIPTFVKRLRAFQARWYFAPAFIEAVAGFKAVPQSLLALDKSLKVQETKVGGDKFVRAQPLSGAWNVGRVLLPTRVIMADGRFSDAPPQWLKEYVKEFAEFTGVGDAQDDQVDATAHAWNAVAMPAPPPTRESQLDQRFRPRGR